MAQLTMKAIFYPEGLEDEPVGSSRDARPPKYRGQDAGDPPPKPNSGWSMSRKSCSPFSIPTFSKFQCNPRRLEWFTTVNLAVEKGEFVEKQ